MTKEKLIYIISLICLGLATLGGGMVLFGFFFNGSIVQLIGVLMLVIFSLASIIFDFIFNRGRKKKK